MTFLKKPAVYVSVIVVLLAIIAIYSIKSSQKAPTGESLEVVVGNIEQEILITGAVKADKRVSLSFDRSGSVSSIPHSIGDTVSKGTILASLRNETERADIAEVEAAIGVAKAQLEGVLRGTRDEEIRVKESAVEVANVSLVNLLEKTGSIITDVYGKAETALYTTIDPLFDGDNGSDPRLTFSVINQSALYESEAKRRTGETSLQVLRGIILITNEEEEGTINSSLEHLYVIQELFLSLGTALQATNGLTDVAVIDYKDRVETARASTAASITALQNHRNSIRDAKVALEKSKRELTLSEAGATSENIIESEQGVLQAKAKLRGARAAFEKTLIRAPFKGKIASKNAEVGETVSVGTVVMEFLGTGGFIIEANVPEADIAKIEKGAIAEVTLDAYGDGIFFPAKVIIIEPTATEIEGVPTYKTTFTFEKDPLRPEDEATDPRLRSGLTANITIRTTLRTDVVVVLARAIKNEDGASYVTRIFPDGTTEKVEVTTGARATNWNVEIIDGLQVGDTVLMPGAK